MNFNDMTISECIDKVNTDLFVPVFQRQLQWKESDIIALFDSIMKDYYIGSLLFWELSRNNVEGTFCYNFIENYIPEETYPSSLNGNRKSQLRTLDSPSQNIRMVIDGQQRINSLYIGTVSGLFKREKGKAKKKEDSWSKTNLYINLRKNPMIKSGIETDEFEFEFREDPEITENKIWYPVGRMLKIDNDTELFEEQERIINNIKAEAYTFNTAVVEQTMDRLYDKIHTEKVLSYYNISNEQESKMHEIFIRTNESGSSLSTGDKVLSKISLLWKNEMGTLPREELDEFVNLIQDNYRNLNAKDVDIYNLLKQIYSIANPYSSLSNMKKDDHKEVMKLWQEQKLQNTIRTFYSLCDEFDLNVTKVNASSLNISLHILHRRIRSEQNLTDSFKRDLIQFIVITQFNTQLTRSKVTRLVKSLENPYEIKFETLDKESEFGLRFELDSLMDRVENMNITRQKLLYKLFDEKRSADADYTDKVKIESDDSPLSKSMINRDYANGPTEYIKQSEKESRLKELKSEEKEKFREKFDQII